MEKRSEDRRYKTLLQTIRCPCCNGKLDYLKLPFRDRQSCLKGTICDFSGPIRFFTPSQWIFLETDGIVCDCGYAAQENLTFKKEAIKLSLHEQLEKQKEMQRVKSTTTTLLANEEEEGDDNRSGASDGKNKMMARIVPLEGFVARRNVQLKGENKFYQILAKVLLAATDEQAATLFQRISQTPKVDGELSRDFNKFFLASYEFQFDFQLVWSKLRKLILDDLAAFRDRTIFPAEWSAAKNQSATTDEELLYLLYLKVTHEHRDSHCLDVKIDDRGETSGIFSQVLKNLLTGLISGREQSVVKLKELQQKLANFEKNRDRDFNLNLAIQNTNVEISLENKNIQNYDMQILFLRLKKQVFNYHFANGDFVVDHQRASLRLEKIDWGKLRGKIPVLLQEQKNLIRELIRKTNLPSAYANLKSELRHYYEWRKSTDPENLDFIQNFSYLLHDIRKRVERPTLLNAREEDILGLDELLLRNRLQGECDFFRGGTVDRVVQNHLTTLSILYSEYFNLLTESATDTNHKGYPLFQKFLEREKSFKHRIIDLYQKNHPEAPRDKDHVGYLEYLKTQRSYLNPIACGNNFRFLSFFWLEDILDSMFRDIFEATPIMVQKTINEFFAIATEFLPLQFRIGKKNSEIEKLKSIQEKYNLHWQKLHSIARMAPHPDFILFYCHRHSHIEAVTSELQRLEKPLIEFLYFFNIKAEGMIAEANAPFDENFNNGQMILERDLQYFLLFGSLCLKRNNLAGAKKNFQKIHQFKILKTIHESSEVFRLYEFFQDLTRDFTLRPSIYSLYPDEEAEKELHNRVRGVHKFSLRYD